MFTTLMVELSLYKLIILLVALGGKHLVYVSSKASWTLVADRPLLELSYVTFLEYMVLAAYLV